VGGKQQRDQASNGEDDVVYGGCHTFFDVNILFVLSKIAPKNIKHNISHHIKSKRANLVKHTFNRLVKITILLRLLSANC
jgi:hypothetical protein